MSTIFVQLGFTKSSVTEILRRVGQGLGNKEEGRRGRGGVADWRARRLLESELLSFTQPSLMENKFHYVSVIHNTITSQDLTEFIFKDEGNVTDILIISKVIIGSVLYR
ncbi:hypothetical protein T4A_9440 [Trichinella pseudospiralis]|uniref:Uncharacterized protein n=1 Tax=Trichinella pseudospiralis TaxID=6337 RepID=A0A0V1E2Y6_TRIPS|nr:hypothetical protein T4A_9440 [Trichinella pseudospiralis]